MPYDARPYAYGRYGYAPYINSYGIPAAVVVDPVDPAYLWRQPYPYGTPFMPRRIRASSTALLIIAAEPIVAC